MKYKIVWLLLGTSLFLSGCEEVIDLKLSQGEKRLVVEGWITTEPGPYLVKLTYTTNYSYTYKDTVVYARNAQVIIQDDLGRSEKLIETTPGVYKTDSLKTQGEVGRTYTLSIRTEDGRSYQSNPELLKAVAKIDSIYYTIERDEGENRIATIYISFQDPPGRGDYYWNVDLFDGKLNNSVWLLSDKHIDGQHGKYGITRGKIYSGYRFQTKLLSLSKEAFEFWYTVEEQISKTRDPYDPPPISIYGNIYNVHDSKDHALGFFAASDVSYSPQIRVSP